MPSKRTDGPGCVPETAEKRSGSGPAHRMLTERGACRKPLKELSNETQVPGGEDVYEFPDDPKDSSTPGLYKLNQKKKKLQGSSGKDPKSKKQWNSKWRTATNMCKTSVKTTSRSSQKYSLSCSAQKEPNYCHGSYSENDLYDITNDNDGDDAAFRVSRLYGSSIIHVGPSSEKKNKVHARRKKRASLNSLINKASQTHLKKVKMAVGKAGEERKFFRSKGKSLVSNQSKGNPITFTNTKDNLCTHKEITTQGETRDGFSYAKSTLDTDTCMSVYDFCVFDDSDPHQVHQEAKRSLKTKTKQVKRDTCPADISLEENINIEHVRSSNVQPGEKDILGENNDFLMVTSRMTRPYIAEHGPRECLYFDLEGQEHESGAEKTSWPQNIEDEVMSSDTDSCTVIDSTGLLYPSDDELCTPGPLYFDTKWAVSHGVRMLQHLAATADATSGKEFKSSCETDLSSMSDTSAAEQLDQDVRGRLLESLEEHIAQGRPHSENHRFTADSDIYKTGQSVDPQSQEKPGHLLERDAPTANSEAADPNAISEQGIPAQEKLSLKNNGPKTQETKPSSGILCDMFQEPTATEGDGILCSYRRMITSGPGQRSTYINYLFQNDEIFL